MNEYINKQKLIKAIEDKRPLNWNDTEAELAEQRAYDDIIGLIKCLYDDETSRINELVEADKEGRCIILSEIKDIEKIPKKEVVATCDIKYCLDYGEYIIGYLFKNNLSDTGYSCENDYDTMLDVTHYGMLPKIVKEGEE